MEWDASVYSACFSWFRWAGGADTKTLQSDLTNTQPSHPNPTPVTMSNHQTSVTFKCATKERCKHTRTMTDATGPRTVKA